ncbi:1,4-alpha-glucan-branching enzyme [Toxoplasma gondii GT1]|uniref:1,4-alpha-glucan branching enzyme n=3 Tax=Toxoplasma gondii TaxID=5811 RepID=S7UM15_TOXGG|nr:1,4-alpha-glucan-branching enzyme [Toxoplasma gondii GT1]KAF4639751.1 1,4-alpha-glucan-branching enzyme [Toxoplasma gondii]RQX67183.1 1,4-alpha-glucan-branching enzyme [Toxoplasma gondii CAST]
MEKAKVFRTVEKQHEEEYAAVQRSSGVDCVPGKYLPSAGPKEPPHTNMFDCAVAADSPRGSSLDVVGGLRCGAARGHGRCMGDGAETDGAKGTSDEVREEAGAPAKGEGRRSVKYVGVPLKDLPQGSSLSEHDVHLLHKAHHGDPFGVLGCHEVKGGQKEKILIVRAWIRNAKTIRLRALECSECVVATEEPVPMEKRADFLFQKAFVVHRLASEKETASSPCKATQSKPGEILESDDSPVTFKYELLCVYEGDETNEERVAHDTYNFGVLLPRFDLELFQSGSCWHVDNLMGSHMLTVEGIRGVRFAVWAPSACFVSVVGDWNAWDGRAHPMRRRVEFGVWELFVPDIGAGEKYGYRIHTRGGLDVIKIDPYAQEFEIPPKTASIISACDDAFRKPEERFVWNDQAWMSRRKQLGEEDLLRRQPMAIYEVHLPSWMRGDNNTYLSYRELADRLVRHVKTMNFTHVEFLPLAHHPFEGSWGYQVTGLYAPYSRLGSPDDFKYLVDKLHQNGIGVFLDFVPAHFCKDSWGLARYDGEPCYEYADPREGEHKMWGTLVFNFRRSEVRSFLLGAAYHWLRRYHIDGLRIDAVSSMLYKNHQREAGDWLPNEFGGDANLQAMSLLQELNWVVHQEFPGVFTMAEESTSWQGVTDKEKGLGFDAKWDLGWMNDTLSYLCLPLYKRPEPACHNKLTFRGLYMAHEKWILPLSHDEVVSGKGSLLDKCGFAGSPFEDRIKTLKTLFGYQVGSPGRPLIFMGAEIGQGREWKDNRSVDWHEGEEELRKKLCIWVSDLLAVYVHHKALHAGDDEPWNFKWTDCDNSKDCVIAFLRSYMDWYNDILVVCNFSPNVYYRYPIGVPHGGEWEVILNSDDWRYAGGMVGPGNLSRVHTTQGGRLGWPYCLWLDLPPFGCLYIKSPQPQPEVKGLDSAEKKKVAKEDPPANTNGDIGKTDKRTEKLNGAEEERTAVDSGNGNVEAS